MSVTFVVSKLEGGVNMTPPVLTGSSKGPVLIGLKSGEIRAGVKGDGVKKGPTKEGPIR